MKVRFERNRTSTIVVMYSLYLYFLGLSLRNTSKELIIFKEERVTSLYGIGFKDLDPVRSIKGKEYQHS
jgi:hypothetical protein